MIRILMLDMGNTLVRERDRTLFPHVLSALDTIQSFTLPSGEPLASCLVSNFPTELPVPAEQLPQVMQTFLTLLPAPLVARFQPVEERITLSAHAGAAKPDAWVFAKAIERLGRRAELNECLFITEEAEHIAACRRLGMATLRFGGNESPAPADADFSDWLDAPLLFARLLDPSGRGNVEAAVQGWLVATAGHLKQVKVGPGPDAGTLRVRAKNWVALHDPALGELDGVHVEMPADFEVHLGERGRLSAEGAGTPDANEMAEATHFVRSLQATGQVATPDNPMPRAATHQVETDAQGRRYLKRKRFSQW